MVAKAEKVLELIRNKSKRVNLALNPQLWSLFENVLQKKMLRQHTKLKSLLFLI